MGKRNKSENSTATSEPQQTTTGTTEVISARYVVVREGYRVSDREYDNPLDPLCVAEVQFWTKVAQNHSDRIFLPVFWQSLLQIFYL